MPEQMTAEKVEHLLYHVGRDEKFAAAARPAPSRGRRPHPDLRQHPRGSPATRGPVDPQRLGGTALTGDVDQKRRLRILSDFKDGQLPVLVATDVASRGLHIEAVTHVVNWDLPQDSEDYVHRIGRTARAGAGGKAIALVDEASALYLEGIEKFIGQKILVEWPEDDLILPEIRPTSEERRRYAEERRARLDARRGRDDRGGGRRGAGGGGGGGRDRGPRPVDRRPGGEPRRETPPTAAPPAAAAPSAGAPGGSGRPRRRRRGRRGGGPAGPSATGGGPAPA